MVARKNIWVILMEKYRYCQSEELRKDGIVKGKQRYKCKKCKRTTRENDKRHK